MRIAFISYEYPPGTAIGGIGTYTFQVANLLANNNFDVHIFAGSHFQSGISSENGIPIHRVKCTGPQDFQKSVLRHFEKEHIANPFHLIESPEIHANAMEIKRKFSSVPLVVRLHASNHLVENLKKKYLPLKNKWRFLLGALRRGKWDLGYWRKYDYKNDPDYLFVQIADYVAAPTLQMKNWAIENWDMKPECIRIIENPFVENGLFKAAHTNNEEPAIIFYGRLNVLKGLITATKAMKNILENYPGWKWIIVGDDGTAANGKDSMKKWIQDYLKQVIQQVSFYVSAPKEQIPFYLRQASIVLVPSLFESYSYVTLEAMCAGKAIIGSKNTGIASLIENNVTGILADPYKIHDWQKAIQQLIDDIELRKRLGKAAYKYAENKHSVNHEIVECYKNMIKQIPVKT
ncbi:MAG: glycosyltransferase family 4 protein [Ginsengibacter sp.]